jgi:hypothetical protein
MQNFKDLIIWNQGIELAVNAYSLTVNCPKKRFMGSQVK